MNNLFIEFDHGSLNKYLEPICGDHIDVVNQNDQLVIVLADGLGSGVKASILSTLTSKIISTMISQGMSLKDCIETIAHTLPICKKRGIAYSTFTVMRFIESTRVEIIEFDNPEVILIRDSIDYPIQRTEKEVSGKTIYYASLELQEEDIFISMSDGCVYAGVGNEFNFGWQKEQISDYMKAFYKADMTAKNLVKILLEKCQKLYDYKPGDDTTVGIARVVKREPLHLMIGPPKKNFEDQRVMKLFFSKAGKKVVCGGTTSELVAKYLHQELKTSIQYIDPNIPPIAYIPGVDLVTEGVITINKVLENIKDYVKDNQTYQRWGYKKDGASLLTRMLIEKSTDIHFYVGQAINPAHQNPDLPIQFNIKMQLVEALSHALKDMGKQITMSYY
mgnify:CR=1 FL=1